MKEMDSKCFLIGNVWEQNADSRHVHGVTPDAKESCRQASEARVESIFLLMVSV